jgi:hypothetical protein
MQYFSGSAPAPVGGKVILVERAPREGLKGHKVEVWRVAQSAIWVRQLDGTEIPGCFDVVTGFRCDEMHGASSDRLMLMHKWEDLRYRQTLRYELSRMGVLLSRQNETALPTDALVRLSAVMRDYVDPHA